MINWIRWNYMKVLAAAVGVAVLAGGIYSVTSLKSAKEGNKVAATIDSLYDCETPSCLTEVVAKYERGELLGFLAEVAGKNTAEASLPQAIREAGGRCAVVGYAAGQSYSAGMTAVELPGLIASIEMIPSDAGTSLAFRCQGAFIGSVAETLAASLSVDEAKALLGQLCEISSDESTGRYRFGNREALCQFSAAGRLAVYNAMANNDEPTWANIVDLCNATGKFNASQCMHGALGAIRAGALSKFSYSKTDCADSVKPGYCSAILADARVALTLPTLMSSKDLPASMTEFCAGFEDETGCRHGFFVGMWRAGGSAVCEKLGTFMQECFAANNTREAMVWTMFSDVKGADLKKQLCTRDETDADSAARCEKVVDGILNYTYTNGIV